MGIFSFPNKEETIRDFLKTESEKELRVKSGKLNAFGTTLFFLILIAGFLSRLGMFPLSIFATFWRFWPVFLLMALLQIFLHKFKLISVAVLGLGLGLIASIVIYSSAAVNSQASDNLRRFYIKMSDKIDFLPIDPGAKYSKSETARRIDKEFEKRQINITLDTGRITVREADFEDNLRIDSTYYEKIGLPIITTNETGDNLLIDIASQFDLGALLGGVEDLAYDIQIGQPEIPTDINLYVGATVLESTFTNLNINNFNFDLGTGLAKITFTDKLPIGDVNFVVNAGVLDLKFPFRTFTRINYKIGAGRLRINDKFVRGTGSFTTTNFRVTADPKDIYLTIKAGDVAIDTRGGEY